MKSGRFSFNLIQRWCLPCFLIPSVKWSVIFLDFMSLVQDSCDHCKFLKAVLGLIRLLPFSNVELLFWGKYVHLFDRFLELHFKANKKQWWSSVGLPFSTVRFFCHLQLCNVNPILNCVGHLGFIVWSRDPSFSLNRHTNKNKI